MNENSPYYLFDPNSPGWIRRRLAKRTLPGGEPARGQRARDAYVSAEDVARVARHHPDFLSDPVIRDYVLELLEGKVTKPKGRPEERPGRTAMIWLAGEMVQEQISEWRAGIGDDRPVKERGGKSPAEAAYEKFGLPLGLSGRALANRVSALKKNLLFGD